MNKKEHKYSIRKLSFGASSIMVASLFVAGAHQADASETDASNNTTDVLTSQTHTTSQAKDVNSSEEAEPSQDTPLHSVASPETEDVSSSEPQSPETSSTLEEAQPQSNDAKTQETATQDVESEQTPSTQDTTPVTEGASTTEAPPSSDDTALKADVELPQTETAPHLDDSTSHETQETAQSNPTEPTAVDAPVQEKIEREPSSSESSTEASTKETPQPQSSESKVETETLPEDAQTETHTPKVETDVNEADVETTPKLETSSTKSQQPKTNETSTQDKTEVTTDTNSDQALHELTEAETTKADVKAPTALDSNHTTAPTERDGSLPDEGLSTLKQSHVATTQSQTNTRDAEKLKEQPNQKAKQGFYKNQDPIILVHGFNSFTDDVNPFSDHYWGGSKLDIRNDLEENGYEAHEASISAFGSNYDRAVELYYYIKGGRVDYGAAHAAKYGHERYGKTYEGVYKDWQPGQKVHLVGHSMGGQTIRQLEELLRNGDPEEIAYQKEHGGDISPLFEGNHDGMITSMTTIGTPHNGTIAADQVGNEPIVRQFTYDFAKFIANMDTNATLGLDHWGIKRGEGENLIDYYKRIKQSNPLWTTEDNGFYDLTRKGAAELNQKTSLNPNIVYKTYTGESTHPTMLGKQRTDLDIPFSYHLTGDLIGKADEPEWRENDGLVSVVSALHPDNQAWVKATDQIQKGIWQVTDVYHGWDHVDFIRHDGTLMPKL